MLSGIVNAAKVQKITEILMLLLIVNRDQCTENSNKNKPKTQSNNELTIMTSGLLQGPSIGTKKLTGAKHKQLL